MHIDKKTIGYFKKLKSVIDDAPFDFDADAVNPILAKLAILTIVDYQNTKVQNTEINIFDIYLGINELLDDTITSDVLEEILDELLNCGNLISKFDKDVKKYFTTDSFIESAKEAKNLRKNIGLRFLVNKIDGTNSNLN